MKDLLNTVFFIDSVVADSINDRYNKKIALQRLIMLIGLGIKNDPAHTLSLIKKSERQESASHYAGHITAYFDWAYDLLYSV